jgi:hypothetical protein
MSRRQRADIVLSTGKITTRGTFPFTLAATLTGALTSTFYVHGD